jgi:RES domain-containing protein
MSIRFNPFAVRIRESLKDAGQEILIPWEGHIWRFNAIEYTQPSEILSGLGALKFGSRWNARDTFPVVYGSTDERIAIAEVKASESYYGLTVRKPRLFVCIRLRLERVLDLSSLNTIHKLGLRLKDIQTEDWRKLHDAGQESLTQSIGRAAADFGAEGILCRSARVKGGLNLAWFPRNRCQRSTVEVCEADLLTSLPRRQSRK